MPQDAQTPCHALTSHSDQTRRTLIALEFDLVVLGGELTHLHTRHSRNCFYKYRVSLIPHCQIAAPLGQGYSQTRGTPRTTQTSSTGH